METHPGALQPFALSMSRPAKRQIRANLNRVTMRRSRSVLLVRDMPVCFRHIRRWRIPSHRLGRVPRYRLEDVMQYLGSQAFRRRLKELKQIREG